MEHSHVRMLILCFHNATLYICLPFCMSFCSWKPCARQVFKPASEVFRCFPHFVLELFKKGKPEELTLVPTSFGTEFGPPRLVSAAQNWRTLGGTPNLVTLLDRKFWIRGQHQISHWHTVSSFSSMVHFPTMLVDVEKELIVGRVVIFERPWSTSYLWWRLFFSRPPRHCW